MTSVKFSVLLSVYSQENEDSFRRALESILVQTVMPSEVIIVKDGIIGKKLECVIEKFKHNSIFRVKVVGTKQNRGLGPALNYGLSFVEYPYVARVDSDDINLRNRFEKQTLFLDANPKVDIVGSQIQEFEEVDEKIVYKGIRRVPLVNKDIRQYSKLRNPMNHMTVMFRKECVTNVGGYRKIPGFEDYDLWLRMLKNGHIFANIADVLILARTSNGFENRRGGMAYFVKSFRARKMFYKEGNISAGYLCAGVVASGLSSLLPKAVRKFVYRHVLRG